MLRGLIQKKENLRWFMSALWDKKEKGQEWTANRSLKSMKSTDQLSKSLMRTLS